MPDYASRPWLALYGDRPVFQRSTYDTALEMFDATVAARGGDIALRYFDGTATWTQLDHAADSLAAYLQVRGFRPGDRLAICTQNNPALIIGLVAAWKAGGCAALISPMSTAEEFAHLVGSYRPSALLALGDIYRDVARPALTDIADTWPVPIVVTASPFDGQRTDDPRVLGDPARHRPADTVDLYTLTATHTRPSIRRAIGPGDIAVLLSTSGTTGFPKGAAITHANLTFNTQTYRNWTGLGADEPILALAPIFHVTGLVAAVALSMHLGSPLVLTHRIQPMVVADAIRAHRPAFAVAAITAYIGLADESDLTADDLRCLRLRYSGGAPIDPDTAARLEDVLGGYIHNIYGQTECTSPSHIVPPGLRAPVDAETGVLSVGIPVCNTMVRVVDDNGDEVPAGEIGELVTSGPQVISQYWDNPAATAAALAGGELHTGDVGFMDAQGWFYVVDRSTDVINASGYKVWPREVERVLLSHPLVRDAAVVAIPDDYRGQNVKAFVVVDDAQDAAGSAPLTEAGLIEFCRARLAAYKYPREVEVVRALPRTATGKLLRRQLRA
ncbi:AMP-binding protein [Gordonia pseudamarae]|uniref:AMP-binding protein n=1 Tax=Gordonia pseudamarae TaxID=2831662 RepID=A0ABX6IIH4_9ACTN|nr:MULTISPECIES: AMP-binding protein [Gordonia]MBD0020944.1 AMP-binding protein [Gordonia sp. (in: high G+C Gram-positive bacteria)]QHN26205.1 AMP-binding protein [Gordonia pseudamarae]QHN35098.1 AMP-binding protein [Gordonia pseudamarae]